MRDIIPLLWVGLVIAGVVSSIARSVRKQAGAKPAMPGRPVPLRPTPRPGPQPPPPAPITFARVSVDRPGPNTESAADAAAAFDPAGSPFVPTPAMVPHLDLAPARRPRHLSLFANRRAAMNAIVAAEVLGKPRALRDEYGGG